MLYNYNNYLIILKSILRYDITTFFGMIVLKIELLKTNNTSYSLTSLPNLKGIQMTYAL